QGHCDGGAVFPERPPDAVRHRRNVGSSIPHLRQIVPEQQRQPSVLHEAVVMTDAPALKIPAMTDAIIAVRQCAALESMEAKSPRHANAVDEKRKKQNIVMDSALVHNPSDSSLRSDQLVQVSIGCQHASAQNDRIEPHGIRDMLACKGL